MFTKAPEPWIDLSTGINPHSYPVFDLPAKVLSRLPERERLAELRLAAAQAYGADSEESVVVSPGTQPIMAFTAGLVRPGCCRILGPTYGEHARCAALAGHEVKTVADLSSLETADLAIIVNPNNPDGRFFTRDELVSLCGKISARGGMLVIDEAFMDVASADHSLTGMIGGQNIVVMRSFGKFFGLAGLRLGFAIATPRIASVLAAALGPWPVAGPALEYGLRALRDVDWKIGMRKQLETDARRLRALLIAHDIGIIGGTGLFQLVHHGRANNLFEHLGGSGIFVRKFADRPTLLRFGLPGEECQWERLETALDSWSRGKRP